MTATTSLSARFDEADGLGKLDRAEVLLRLAALIDDATERTILQATAGKLGIEAGDSSASTHSTPQFVF